VYTLADQVTEGLKDFTVPLRVAVMGCIVNGPGEMADADYGYVGAKAGCISLYKGKECVKKNIPESEAVDELLRLIEDLN
jgi:(E)-4-hydroxy-3-methylbut-2-enyl-diphosphate synthase